MKRTFLALTIIALAASNASTQLTLADVQQVIAQAATRADQISTNSVIAVTDREGYVLGVWSVNGTTPAASAFTDLVANATAKAGTAAFLSSDQHAFTTRTAGFQEMHFDMEQCQASVPRRSPRRKARRQPHCRSRSRSTSLGQFFLRR